MKAFRFSLIIALCLFVGTQSFATSIIDSNKDLRREVSKMIDTPDLEAYGLTETMVFVNFTINENNEIIVLDVVSENDDIRETVFNSLNLRKVNTSGLEPEVNYTVKVAFRAEQA
jgi:hypothetical protein